MEVTDLPVTSGEVLEPGREVILEPVNWIPEAGVTAALAVISADGDPDNLDILMDSILTMKLARLDNNIAMRQF